MNPRKLKFTKIKKGTAMFDILKNFLADEFSSAGSGGNGRKIKIATCSLFLVLAKSDDDFTTLEFQTIMEVMKNLFAINPEEAQELIDISEEAVKRSVSVYEFTDTINNYFDEDQKYEIIKNLWRLVLADNILNKYEEHLIRIISTNLRLSHRDFIAAKLEVKSELGNADQE